MRIDAPAAQLTDGFRVEARAPGAHGPSKHGDAPDDIVERLATEFGAIDASSSSSIQMDRFDRTWKRARPTLDAEAALVEEVDIHHVFRWVCELYYNVAGLLDVLLRMGHVLLRLEVPAYHEVCALDAWGDLLAASYFVDTLLHRTKEETLSPEAA